MKILVDQGAKFVRKRRKIRRSESNISRGDEFEPAWSRWMRHKRTSKNALFLFVPRAAVAVLTAVGACVCISAQTADAYLIATVMFPLLVYSALERFRSSNEERGWIMDASTQNNDGGDSLSRFW